MTHVVNMLALSTLLSTAGIEVSEYTWNFGNIPKNAYAAHVFVIKNRGTQPVKVRKMRRFCSCLIYALSDTIFYPNTPVELKVGYYSGQKSTNEQNKIYLTTDDPEKEVLKFTLKAWVGKDMHQFRVEPNRLKVTNIKSGFLRAYNRSDSLVKLDIVYATAGIEVKPETTMIRAQDSIKIHYKSKYKAFDEPPSIVIQFDTSRITIPIDTK